MSESPEVSDRITKVGTSFPQKDLSPRYLFWKTGNPFDNTAEIFPKKTNLFVQDEEVLSNWIFPEEKLFSSEKSLGEVKCSFLKPNETFSDELRKFLSRSPELLISQTPKKKQWKLVFCQTLCFFAKLSIGLKESSFDRSAEKNISKIRNSIAESSKNTILLRKRKLLPQKVSLETQESFLTTLPEIFDKRLTFWLQIRKKKCRISFFWREKLKDFFKTCRKNIWKTAKFFSPKVPETIDQITKAITSLFKKSYILTKSSEKLASVYDNTAERFPKNRNLLLRSKILCEIESFLKKNFFLGRFSWKCDM